MSSPKMSFGERMLKKHGWKEGEGLGKTGTGRLELIPVRHRPERAGLGRIQEMTAAERQEQQRQARLHGFDLPTGAEDADDQRADLSDQPTVELGEAHQELKNRLSNFGPEVGFDERFSSIQNTLRNTDNTVLADFKLGTVVLAACTPALRAEMKLEMMKANPADIVTKARQLRNFIHQWTRDPADCPDPTNRHALTTFDKMMFTTILPLLQSAINETNVSNFQVFHSFLRSSRHVLKGAHFQQLLFALFTKVMQHLSSLLETSDFTHGDIFPIWLGEYFEYFPMKAREEVTEKARQVTCLALPVWYQSNDMDEKLRDWVSQFNGTFDVSFILFLQFRSLLLREVARDLPEQHPFRIYEWKRLVHPLLIPDIVINDFFPALFTHLHAQLTRSDWSFRDTEVFCQQWHTFWTEPVNKIPAVAAKWLQVRNLVEDATRFGDEGSEFWPCPPAPEDPTNGFHLHAAHIKTNFAEMVKHFCEANGLFLLPLREVTPRTGIPLFWIAGKWAVADGGVIVAFTDEDGLRVKRVDEEGGERFQGMDLGPEVVELAVGGEEMEVEEDEDEDEDEDEEDEDDDVEM